MLKELFSEDFKEIYRILSASFPVDEIRPHEQQKALFQNPIYHVYGLCDGEMGDVQAVIAVYELEKKVFVEHFAVHARFRNGGLGSKILSELMKHCGKPIVLEVELPETELARRRIGFYERNGLYYNDFFYVQPPLAEGQNPIELRIMSSGAPLTAATFAETKRSLYEEVYSCGENAVFEIGKEGRE